MNQKELSKINETAWNSNSYDAWVSHYGTPSTVAEAIQADPHAKLRRLIKFLPALQGLKIANPLGSHGRIATALALLGAHVTVFDISESNARYASELFAAAGIDVNYELGDFQSTAELHKERFDAVVMELGILHYFTNITKFAKTVRSLTPFGGLLVLNEFHPLKKAISISAGDVSVSGDYFFAEQETSRTPFEAFTDEDIPTCLIRRWNLGEVVTAFATAGFRIQQLVEHPSNELAQLPGSYTLVATAD